MILPVTINVSTASKEQLREECKRLHIPVDPRTQVSTMRKKLFAHQRAYTDYQKWVRLAQLLYGESHEFGTRPQNNIITDILNRLYTRLCDEGYVGEDAPRITDAANQKTFVVRSRQNVRVLNTREFRAGGDPQGTNGACDILFAARRAFPDVDEALREWEK